MANLAEVGKILGGLAILYPRFKLTPQTIHGYHRILGDLPADVLDKAALQIGAESTFFPSASELRKMAFALYEEADGIPLKERAWAEVWQAFGVVGHVRMPEWSHPIIGEAVAAMGGWRELCLSENGVADRAHFFKIYDALIMRQRETSRMLPEVKQKVEELAAGMSKDGKDKRLLSGGS